MRIYDVDEKKLFKKLRYTEEEINFGHISIAETQLKMVTRIEALEKKLKKS